MYEHRSAPVLPFREFLIRLARHGGLTVALLSASLAIGMVGYRELAGMTWIDAFVNASMILGGMGPVDALSGDGAKLFAGLYALYSGLALLAVAGIMITPVVHRLLHKLHAEEDV